MYFNNSVEEFNFNTEYSFVNTTFKRPETSSAKMSSSFMTLMDSNDFGRGSEQRQKYLNNNINHMHTSNKGDDYSYNFMEENTSNQHQLNFEDDAFDLGPFCQNFLSEYNTQISNVSATNIEVAEIPVEQGYIAKKPDSLIPVVEVGQTAIKDASVVRQSVHSVSQYFAEFCEDSDENYSPKSNTKAVNLCDFVNSEEHVPPEATSNVNYLAQNTNNVYLASGTEENINRENLEAANLTDYISNVENKYYYVPGAQEAGNQVDFNKLMLLFDNNKTVLNQSQMELVKSLQYANEMRKIDFQGSAESVSSQQMHQVHSIQKSKGQPRTARTHKLVQRSPDIVNEQAENAPNGMLNLQADQIINQIDQQIASISQNTPIQNQLLLINNENNGAVIKKKAVTYENGKVFDFSDLEIFIKDELEHKTKRTRLIQCAHCSSNVSVLDFKKHRCVQSLALKPLPVSDLTIDNTINSLKVGAPAAFRLLRENQIRVRRFLKDELKFDVNTYGNNNSEMGSRFNSKKYGPHECNLCERKFVHASGLLRHMEKHELDLIPTTTTLTKQTSRIEVNPKVNALQVVIKCILCGRIFFETCHAMQHLLSLHFIGIKSEDYETNFSTTLPFENYIDECMNFLRINDGEHGFAGTANNEWRDENPRLFLKMVILSCVLQCEFCDFFFSDVSSLFVHSGFHRPSRPFECFQCEIYVKTSKDISLHWQGDCVYTREHLKEVLKSITRFYVCNICGNKFQSLEQLHDHRHAAYHYFPRFNGGNSLQVSCEQCGDLFDEAQQAAVHYEQKHSRRYKRDKEPEKQEKSRQFLCDICGKSYTQSSHLWQHLRFHQGVKPFACAEPGCLRRFTIRPDLNDHIRKCHTGERPYHCAECGKRFLTGSVFYQHRLIHRGERRYECEECGKRFYRADALKNHQRIHTGEKPYSCLFCTKTFRQRGDRDKHIRARHAHLNQRSRLMMQMQKLQLETKAAALQAVEGNPLVSHEYTQVATDGALLPTQQLTEIVNSTVQNFLPPPLYELSQEQMKMFPCET